MKKLLFLAFIGMWVACAGSYAQNWRTPNPNQPNGYRATEASYHFHGSYKEPSQPSNGYRASEARSHVGMNSFAPPSTSEKSGGGRWGENGGSRFSGGEGSRWGGKESGGAHWGGSEGRFGEGESSRFGGSENRRWGNATGSSFQTGGGMQNRQEEWNEFYKRRFEATEQGGYNNAARGQEAFAQQSYENAPQQQYANAAQQQYANTPQRQYASAQQQYGYGGYSQPGASFGSAQAMRAAVGASAVRRMLRNGDDGNFNRVYSSNSGGFNRIYGSP